MANTITRQRLTTGRFYTVHFTIIGDGSGEETAVRINAVDGDLGNTFRIMYAYAAFSGFSGTIYFDASSAGDRAMALQVTSDVPHEIDFDKFGGLFNGAGTTKNGNLILKTNGLTTDDSGHITLNILV